MNIGIRFKAVVFFTVLFANSIAIGAFSLLGAYMVPARYQQKWEALVHDPYHELFANSLPFLIVMILVFVYLMPIKLKRLNDTTRLSDTGRVRLLNTPVFISRLTILGWILGGINAEIYLIITNANELVFDIFMQISAVIIGSLTFIISYYLLEFLNRTYFIPKIFPNAKLEDMDGSLSVSVRAKLFIFLFSVFLLPGAVLLSVIYNLNNNGNNPFQTDIFASVVIIFAVFFIVSLIITFMKSASIRLPLSKMEKMAREITLGNYDVYLPINSKDEIGSLSESLNRMTDGLREREQMRDVFGKMVDPRVRDYLLAGDLKLGGELREVTVLFCDIKNYTSIAENLPPEEVLELLNSYFDSMAACISAENGVINKFIGDAIMAVFGTPLLVKNHAEHAYKAALAMIAKQNSHNANLSGSKPKIESRIGIHTGEVIAGNLGSTERMEYTVIGDVVNTASRLETLCKKFECNLLVSSATVNSIEVNHVLKYKGEVELKGKKEHVEVYGL
jgi:adenylate cyclase